MNASTEHAGKIIMFDGPDGVGKTEQVRLAANALQEQGRTVYTTRVHGGTPIGEALRNISLSNIPRKPQTDLLISRAMHAELADDLVEKRQAGIVCLIDRSPLSMWSYQVRASGLSEAIARPVIDADLRQFQPDLILVLTSTLAVLSERLHSAGDRKTDYFESQPDDFQQRVIDGYTEAAAMFGGRLINASDSIDSVHQHIMRVIADDMLHSAS